MKFNMRNTKQAAEGQNEEDALLSARQHGDLQRSKPLDHKFPRLNYRPGIDGLRSLAIIPGVAYVLRHPVQR